MVNQPVAKDDATLKSRRTKRRRTVTTAELYAALDALLPFAAIEIECSTDFCSTCPQYATAEDAVYSERGRQALALAQGLISRKTGYIRQQERALKERPEPGDGDTLTAPEAADG